MLGRILFATLATAILAVPAIAADEGATEPVCNALGSVATPAASGGPGFGLGPLVQASNGVAISAAASSQSACRVQTVEVISGATTALVSVGQFFSVADAMIDVCTSGCLQPVGNPLLGGTAILVQTPTTHAVNLASISTSYLTAQTATGEFVVVYSFDRAVDLLTCEPPGCVVLPAATAFYVAVDDFCRPIFGSYCI